MRIGRPRRPRHIRAQLLGLLVGGAAVTAGVPTPAVADDIPRPPGAIENRGWELVNPADINGNQVRAAWALSDDGSRVQYSVDGGMAGSPTGAVSSFEAVRGSSGWVSHTLLPPADQLIAETYYLEASAPDLSGGIWQTTRAIGGLPTQTPYVALVRLDADGSQTVLYKIEEPQSANSGYVASDDLRHVYGSVRQAIDGAHVTGTDNVYDFGSGVPVLVSRMPGTGLPPACGVPFGDGDKPTGFAYGQNTVSEHWTSTDGARVWFLTPGDDCSDPMQLYMRDVDAGTTTLVSGPPLAGDADHGVQRFLQATPDGSRAFYRTATNLDDADDGDGDSDDLDIYRWTASGGNVCLTCAVPGAEVSPGTGSGKPGAAISEDGSHVYFTSPNQLADAPVVGDVAAPNLYVWRADGSSHGTIEFVAPSDGVDPWGKESGTGVTPDGSVLIFRSRQPGLDARSGSQNGGFFQFYRYDDGDGDVVCVSCPAPGSATVDVTLNEFFTTQVVTAPLRFLTDDGDTFVFHTDEALVADDVNGGPDIYEWHDGTLGLITSGAAAYTGLRPKLVTISRDGRDILFADPAPLVADVQGYATRLYDARIDGGFAPSPPPPAPCEGDACQGPPPSAPGLLDPGLSIGGDSFSPKRAVQLTVARVSKGARARLMRTGRLALRVRVSGACKVAAVGTAAVRGQRRVVMRGAKALHDAGTATLRLRLSRAGRGQLPRAGRLRVVLVVRCSTSASTRRLVLRLGR